VRTYTVGFNGMNARERFNLGILDPRRGLHIIKLAGHSQTYRAILYPSLPDDYNWHCGWDLAVTLQSSSLRGEFLLPVCTSALWSIGTVDAADMRSGGCGPSMSDIRVGIDDSDTHAVRMPPAGIFVYEAILR